MATSTITGLPAVAAINLDDAAVVPVDDNTGATRKATIAQLKTALGTNITGHAAYRTTTQALVANGTWQTIVFPATDYGSGIIDTSTGIATIPSTGLYRVQFSARVNPSSSAAVRLLLNGVTELHSDVMTAFPAVIEDLFTAGDTLRVQVQDNSSGLVIAGNEMRTHFRITKLGSF